MATAPANDGFEDVISPGDIILLDPNEIDVGERLRPIDASWATAIGQSMKRDGQIHAVDVRRRGDGGWILAGAGGHRVTGARIAGIPIDARVVMFDDAFARQREAAENLFRRSNDPLERAEAIAELARLHREKAGIDDVEHREKSLPKRLKAEAAGTCDTMSHVYGWAADVADELGFSKRTVQRDLFLYRGLRPSIVQQLRDNKHPVLKNAGQLRALAKLDPDAQSRIARRLIAGDAKSVTDAVRIESGSNSVRKTAEDKRLSAFLDSFSRMSLAEKRGALAQLKPMIPAPFNLVEGK